MWLYIILYIIGGLITTKFIISTFPPGFVRKADLQDCVAVSILFLSWPLFIIFLIIICPILYLIGRLLMEMFER